MRPDQASLYEFRPLAAADLPLVERWLRTPHVARWWGDPEEEIANIASILASDSTRAYLMLFSGRPVGYIQSYDIHAEADHPYRDQPVGSIGIDLSIGEADLIGKGHGPRFIAAFVDRLFAEGAPRVVIDPDPDNAAAIGAYRKAGFRPLGHRTSIYGDALIMVRDRVNEMSVT